MAASPAPGERLKTLRADIARDAAEVRRRWRAVRERVPREWREVRVASREVLDLLWLVLRRRAPADRPAPPPPR
ncbi:MAG: hypothetical protein QN152_09125 [Armatimonadota bacterium]|nr:hypothetical protein [Armatimonadota bacterium]MDR7427812.1 hypothetical protein [Armatimonadota bacterium]MDR7463129.1 hypothetical protein [Armatimonadota bacterium]MDR7468884.1 hypothetical protein [Armatimonadota bacterium]MDR7474875.1 hypothetical protein [Armatimonadota bacterium]